jgi:methyl-accepting chemotaxis protein
MTELSKNGAVSHKPDSSWCQVRETTLMLELATGQIEAAMKDSNTSVDVLTDSFTTMAGYLHMITTSLGSLSDEGEAGETKKNILEAANHVTGMVHQSIVAFQFYDKLTQRLAHVSHSLAALNDLVGDEHRVISSPEWQALREKIRSKYTSVDECAMFDAVMSGMSVHEALANYMSNIKDKGSDIDLF